MSNLQQASATIASGGTTSGAIAAPDKCELVGVFVPVMTGTALTLTASTTATGTYVAVKDKSNAAISHTVDGTAHYMALDPALYGGLQNFKLVSGSTEGADRVFTLIFRKRPT